jgi:hypothetical protein
MPVHFPKLKIGQKQIGATDLFIKLSLELQYPGRTLTGLFVSD